MAMPNSLVWSRKRVFCFFLPAHEGCGGWQDGKGGRAARCVCLHPSDLQSLLAFYAREDTWCIRLRFRIFAWPRATQEMFRGWHQRKTQRVALWEQTHCCCGNRPSVARFHPPVSVPKRRLIVPRKPGRTGTHRDERFVVSLPSLHTMVPTSQVILSE